MWGSARKIVSIERASCQTRFLSVRSCQRPTGDDALRIAVGVVYAELLQVLQSSFLATRNLLSTAPGAFTISIPEYDSPEISFVDCAVSDPGVSTTTVHCASPELAAVGVTAPEDRLALSAVTVPAKETGNKGNIAGCVYRLLWGGMWSMRVQRTYGLM